MLQKPERLAVLLLGLCPAFLPAVAWAQAAPAKRDQQVQQRLNELKAMKKELQDKMQDFDARIRKLEAAEKEQAAQAAAAQKTAGAQKAAEAQKSAEAHKAAAAMRAPSNSVVVATAPAQNQSTPPSVNLGDVTPDPDGLPHGRSPYDDRTPGAAPPESWGTYQPGRGFILLRGDIGELSVSMIAYARYLNQTGLDKSYTDSFGRTTDLHLRQDIQWNKVNLSFKGWMFDPDFTYRVWIWTQQPAMGEPSQVVVGGHLGYHITDWLNVYAGIAPLPSTRSTNWSYPFWLKMDNRTIADEFFRASYSQGIWADGEIVEGLDYRVMLSNNLSALGVSASQLNSGLNTISSFIWWMPTTGEFGPATGFGDFEGHEKAATLIGMHYTRSREDAQEQPGTNAIENSQIRLSDGTLLFSPNAFNTGGRVTDATYQMLDLDTGVKYRGFSLEAEVYWRWVNDFRIIGNIPVDHLYDTGFQLQGSAMIVPRRLQAYVSGSQVFGQYGNPWDISTGLNWYPFARREMHINAEAIYDNHSPVGGASYPYIVGGNGWLYHADVILTF